MNYFLIIPFFFLFGALSQAEAPKVVVSIKPIHSLVAGVMKGVAMPKLLLESHEDPHHFSLTPSEAKALQNADLVVWVGPQMELTLPKAIKTLVTKGRILTLLDVPQITRHELEPGHVDPHIWLDPDNAKIVVRESEKILAGLDPEHAGIYQENADRLEKELDILTAQIRQQLEPIKNAQYLVYHDAYQYFEKAFGLSRSIPVVKDTEGNLRASQRKKIQELVQQSNIHCIFGEPYHGEEVVQSLAEQLHLNVSFLDPLGLNDKSEPEGSYMAMMQDIANSLKSCLEKGHKS